MLLWVFILCHNPHNEIINFSTCYPMWKTLDFTGLFGVFNNSTTPTAIPANLYYFIIYDTANFRIVTDNNHKVKRGNDR